MFCFVFFQIFHLIIQNKIYTAANNIIFLKYDHIHVESLQSSALRLLSPTKMRFFTLILMLTSCTFSNGSQISRKSNAFPKSDQLLLSSLTEAQREQLRSHFLTLLGVSTVQPAFNFNISLQANDLRASLPLTRKPALSAFDFNPRTIAQKSHVRSRREALPAHAHYLAGLRAIHFENLQLPTGRSLGAVSAVRIHASRGT